MYVPTKIMKHGDFSIASVKKNYKRIFGDKVVNKKISPLLYNIECGFEEMSISTTGRLKSKRKTAPTPLSSDRGNQARSMLLQCNVSFDSEGKNFSLLTSMSNKPGLHSKNIMDKKQFQKTKNQYVTAEKQFKSNQDPFYDLDENEFSSKQYNIEKNLNGQAVSLPDLSKIAYGVVYVNMSKNHKGKSKYFLKPIPYGGSQ